MQAAGDRYLLPFFVNFHHALADGLHIARFVKYIITVPLTHCRSHWFGGTVNALVTR